METLQLLQTASISFAVALFIFMPSEAPAWKLFSLFNSAIDPPEKSSGENFDPKRDILYIPGLDNRSLFESINDLSIFNVLHR